MRNMPKTPRTTGLDRQSSVAACFKTIKEAEAVVGKFGKPSKMPGYAYGIPAQHCQVGATLVNIPGSVCANCYALKGRYAFGAVKRAQEYRFNSLKDPRWVEAMSYIINQRKCDFFRWHDAGDIQGMWHLENIVQVAVLCPATKFWLPTRENKTVHAYLASNGSFPVNLVVRVSGTMVDGQAPIAFYNTSTVVTKDPPTCPAYTQGGVCGSCRACWDPKVRNISYPRH